MEDDDSSDHTPEHLAPHTHQMLEEAYARVLEARALVLGASDTDEHTEAHIRLAHAHAREQQLRAQVLDGGNGGDSGSVQGGRSESSDDPDIVNEEEEADEIDGDERFGHRGNNTPTKNAKPQTLFGSADLPIHPPLVGHMRLKSYLRERRHASLSVLTDQELLMNHAVANYETIPETRRRFQHHYIGLSMPENYIHAFALQDKILGPKKTPTTRTKTSNSITPASTATDKGKGKGKATEPTTSSPNHNHIPFTAGTAATTASSAGSASPLPIEPRLPIVDILEVDGGWRNRGVGDEGYGPVALPRSVATSASASASVSDAMETGNGGGSGAGRGTGRGGGRGKGVIAGSSEQGRRRSARHAAGGVG
ncbi:hypothetical protein AJ78_06438 [Emergomyces pasteurianus Ep9510]|uniref:Uncharacterized protein n=1 Tax=Emergomyces pasteurianus Ep9510 TaxID=1447872 RepID=A0A1J9PAT3_9EURO|nr:hypothetical protein AJ78_06438 [Emergomyces pasteurianus Ep9510]